MKPFNEFYHTVKEA